MTNIRIKVLDINYIVVIADSERFEKNEIMFEGNTFDECLLYIVRATGMEQFDVTVTILDKTYIDRTGKELPIEMRVVE